MISTTWLFCRGPLHCTRCGGMKSFRSPSRPPADGQGPRHNVSHRLFRYARGSGGTGRRAGFRFLWGNTRGGSSPLFRKRVISVTCDRPRFGGAFVVLGSCPIGAPFGVAVRHRAEAPRPVSLLPVDVARGRRHLPVARGTRCPRGCSSATRAGCDLFGRPARKGGKRGRPPRSRLDVRGRVPELPTLVVQFCRSRSPLPPHAAYPLRASREPR